MAARKGMKVVGNHKFAMALREFGTIVQDELFKHIAITAHKITVNARARAPVNTGRLQSGIKRYGPKRRAGKRSFGITARVGATAPYSAWVEFGSWMQTKRKIQFKMPPFNAGSLVAWGGTKGIKNMYPIASTLKNGGIKKRPFLGPAYVAAKASFYNGVYRIISVKAPAMLAKKYG